MNIDANKEALAKISACRPMLAGVVVAREALGLEEGELGHAGPPFAEDDTLPPTVLNGLAGGAVHEGYAPDMDTARDMIRRREIRLRHNHGLGTVSPMSGVVRPSQMLMRVIDADSGAVVHATLAEQGRRALRFGAYDAQVAEGLRFVDEILAPALDRALPKDGLAVWPLVAQGVGQGDDVHQRNVGGMAAFIAALDELPTAIRHWLAATPQHFLNYAMASAKLSLDRARGVAGSTIVTALSRNGLTCGIKIAGRGDEWFTAPATTPVGGWFESFGEKDAQLDLGDSAIVEAFGLGGCIAHCSPEIARTMGQDWAASVAAGKAMRRHFIGRNPLIAPALAGAEGVGLGLDAAAVAASGAGLRIHTGISHRDGESGWIGIGVAEAPLACFTSALGHKDAT